MDRHSLLQGVSVSRGDAKLKVSKDGMEAFLVAPSGSVDRACREEAMKILEDWGIVHGILPSPRHEGDKWVIARGDHPEAGADAVVTCLLPLSGSDGNDGADAGDGYIRERNAFTNCRKGEVIARKTPPGQGAAGKNVFGEEVPAKPGRWIPFPAGQGTEISSDDLNLLAARTGILVQQDGKLTVLDEYEMPGPVDASSGHVEFLGKRLVVNGPVDRGYRVTVAGDLHIRGHVEEGARITVGGRLEVAGIIRGQETRVKVMGDCVCTAVEQASLDVGGDLDVRDYLLSAICVVSGNVTAVSGKGLIDGGETSAGGSVAAKVAGNWAFVPTKLSAGHDIPTLRKIESLVREVEGIARRLEDVKSGLLKISAMGEKGINDPKIVFIKERLDEAAMSMGQEIFKRNAEIAELEKIISGSEKATIRISGDAFANVTLFIAGASFTLSDPASKLEAFFREGSLGIRNL